MERKYYKPTVFSQDVDQDSKLNYFDLQISIYSNILDIYRRIDVIRHINQVNYGIMCLCEMPARKRLSNDLILHILEFLPSNDVLLRILDKSEKKLSTYRV